MVMAFVDSSETNAGNIQLKLLQAKDCKQNMSMEGTEKGQHCREASG